MRTTHNPLAALLLSAALIAGCTKEEDDPEPAPAPPDTPDYAITSAPVWAAVINGAVETVQGTAAIEPLTDNTLYTSPNRIRFRSFFYDVPADETVLEVSFGKMPYSGATPTNAEMLAYFAPGDRAFAQMGGDGVLMSKGGFSDPLSTDLGVQPAESKLTIHEVQEYDDGSGVYKLKIKATFTCTFFGSGGSSQTATDGILVMIYENEP